MRAPAILIALTACAHAPRFPDPASFATGGELQIIAGPTLHGRDAIARALAATGVRIAIGRQWIHGDTRVIELVFTATRAAHPIGVVGAAVVTVDADGLITTARLYVDVATIVGQIDPARLPAGAKTRTVATAPPAGTAITATRGTPTEAANQAAADQMWSRLGAHDPDGVLALAATDYVYDDLSGPAPLDKAGTLALLRGFLPMVPDFAIAATPTRFAAGDDVVTESIEHMTVRGRAIALHSLDVKHFAAGVLTREWQYANYVEVITELLGLPAPAIP